MRPHPLTRYALLPVIALACLVLVGCGGTTAASSGPVDEAKGSATDAQSDTTGIHVNGAWEVTVRDPNGTIADHHEFHNDTSTTGRRALAAFVGEPGSELQYIRVSADFDSELCDAADQPNCSFTSTSAWDDEEAVVESTVEATTDGELTSVYTRIGVAHNIGTFSGTLTERDLDTPISFVAGQTVDITVRVSFS